MFELYANKASLTVRRREPLTSGVVDAVTAEFEFSADWEGLTRTAVFQCGGTSKSVLLGADGQCAIPWEVLSSHGRPLMAGVFGTRGGEVVLPTVWASLGTILEADTDKGAWVVRFDGMETPRKISFRAKLERAEGSQ